MRLSVCLHVSVCLFVSVWGMVICPTCLSVDFGHCLQILNDSSATACVTLISCAIHSTARAGDAAQIAHAKLTSRRRALANFVTDARVESEFPPAPASVRTGRTHYPLDPAIHTDARANVTTTGHGGYAMDMVLSLF
jgi:hypothetical protein